MRAVVYDGSLSCRDVPAPERGREAVITVGKAGICGTDLAIASGKYKVATPLVLGHEIFGTVRSAPAGQAGLEGRRAVTEITAACGECDFCQAGVKSQCRSGRALGIHRDGGFAEYVSTPAGNIHLVPDSISDEEAVFIEPLAACVQITKMGEIEAGSTCAVVGAGRMGLLTVQVLRRTRPRVLAAIGHTGAKLGMARGFGAEPFDAAKADESLSLTGGAGFDNVVEASGSPGGVDLALRLVKPRGTLHLKSTHGLPAQLDITKVVVAEIRVQGSRCGPFQDAIGLLGSGEVKVKEMITDRFPLEECSRAFERASSRSSIKTIFGV